MSSIIGLADELAAAAWVLEQAAPSVTIRTPAAGRTIRTTGPCQAASDHELAAPHKLLVFPPRAPPQNGQRFLGCHESPATLIGLPGAS